MGLKVCAVPGCPRLQREGKCAEHRREAEQKRGTRQARGYGAEHDKLRAHYQRRMDDGERFVCWRCHRRGVTHYVDPTSWDLGHDDHDRTKYRGPECPAGNRAVASRISPGA